MYKKIIVVMSGYKQIEFYKQNELCDQNIIERINKFNFFFFSISNEKKNNDLVKIFKDIVLISYVVYI